MSSFSFCVISGVAAFSLTYLSPASKIYELMHPDECTFFGDVNDVERTLLNAFNNKSLESKGYIIDGAGDLLSDFPNNFSYSDKTHMPSNSPATYAVISNDDVFTWSTSIKQIKVAFGAAKIKDFIADDECAVFEYPDFVPDRNIRQIKVILGAPKIKEFVS